MKTRNTIFVFGAALAVSFGVFCSTKNYEKVNAASTIDIGTIEIDYARNAISTDTDIYLVPKVENELPDSWSYAYYPVGDADGIFVNGVKADYAEIKHAGTGSEKVTFFFRLNKKAETDDVVEFKGTWASTTDGNTTYKFTFDSFAITWNGLSWQEKFIIPELESYDKITLIDACFDDQDHVSFDTNNLEPNVWNTYVASNNNTTNSFAFEFEFESFGSMTSSLSIRVGTSAKYDTGHYYKLDVNNTWGPSGVMVFYEMNGGATVYRTPDITCDLKNGRHTIEFGSICIKNSSDVYDYVMYDNVYLYQAQVTPDSNQRSTKVSYYYSGKNIFFGSTHGQKENTQILKFNRLSENKQGVYLDGTINSIPASWDVKGAPASKYNALINGQPMFTYGSNSFPMAKPSAEEENAYYLDLNAGNISLKEGDVITLSDEFHFYANDKAYSMSVIPVSFLFSKNQMSQINDIYAYMESNIENRCDPDYYDEDKLIIIDGIIEEAKLALPEETNMKALWDLYLGYLEDLDAVPYNEEKAREILENAKNEAKVTLNAFIDEDNYSEDNLALVTGLVNEAIEAIESEDTDTVAKVQQVVEEYSEEIAKIETKQQTIEKEIMAADELLVEYLDAYDVITTTDFSAVGDMVFHDSNDNSYHSGGYDDTTTRFAASNDNPNGNYIFQCMYESDNPNARKEGFGAQIYIRARSSNASTCYRFDIATAVDGAPEDAGVAICTLQNDIAVGRKVYNAQLKENTQYKIECGTIDLKEYNRTLLFMKVNDEFVLKSIVDSLPEEQGIFRIMDSFVPAPYESRLSAIEEGTTKEDVSTLIGRPILDSSSDKDTVLVNLRDNNIEIGATLYPNEKGAFKINDEEVNGIRPSTYLQKTGQNKYLVITSNHEFQDGDTIYLGGYYSVFNVETFVKSSYRLFETTLTYNASSNSWSQVEPTDLDVVIYEAKETIQNYVDLNNYSASSAQAVQDIVDEYIPKIDEATSIEEVSYILEEGLKKIDAVPTLFDDYKEAAKEELRSYRSPDLYRAEEKAELSKILNDAYAQIDNCNDNDSVDLVVIKAKSDIDVLKTAAERDAEDLANAKKAATNDVQAYSGLLQMQRYDNENAEKLTNMTYTALSNIDKATSIEEVNRIVNEYKETVKKVPTNDGSTFDGEKYIEKARSSGCGGTIETTTILSFVALFGAAMLMLTNKFKKEN